MAPDSNKHEFVMSFDPVRIDEKRKEKKIRNFFVVNQCSIYSQCAITTEFLYAKYPEDRVNQFYFVQSYLETNVSKCFF